MEKYSFRHAMLVDIENVYELIAGQNMIGYGSAKMTLNNLQNRWRGDYHACLKTSA